MVKTVVEAPASLADLLTLSVAGENRFVSRHSESNRNGDVFGGQYLGQSLASALATAPDFAPQAMFCFFLRGASASQPIDYSVERTREGRRFAHRRITATQAGQEVFRAEVALHKPESGHPCHQQAMAPAAGPDGLRTMADLARQHVARVGESALARIEGNRLADMRPIDPEIGFVRAGQEPALRCWVRGMLAADAAAPLQYAALAYLTDYFAPIASRIMHSENNWGPDITALSLNHTISFHALPRAGDWLLFDMSSQFAGGGIGSNRNLVHGIDGRLVASVTQDAMLRYT